MNQNFSQPLAEIARRALTTVPIPGASIAVLVDGQPVFADALGFRDLEQTTPLDPQARFYMYSITKTLIAAVILQLAGQGWVGLEAPVQEYLPGLPLPTPVTLRQLLQHTGGIPDYGGMRAYHTAVKASPAHPWTVDEFLAVTLPNGLRFEPGQGWGYSNIGFLLLRRVIETVLGTSLRAALHERIFAPLGLTGPVVAETLEDARSLTPGYSAFFTDGSLQDVRAIYHPGWVSHGVVIATAAELARTIDAVFAGPADFAGPSLSPESRAAMLEPVDVAVDHPFFQQPAYGLGVMIDRRSRFGMMAGHGGSGPGYSAGALHLPDAHDHRVTSVALVNSDRDDLGLRLAFDVIMAVGDALTTDF